METLTDFRSSRIYAQGWNAGRSFLLDPDKAINPYEPGPAHARWAEGFAGLHPVRMTRG